MFPRVKSGGPVLDKTNMKSDNLFQNTEVFPDVCWFQFVYSSQPNNISLINVSIFS